MDTVINVSNKENIVLKAISAREVVVLVPNSLTIKPKKSENKIEAITIGKHSIVVGEILHLNSSTTYGKIPFKVNHIQFNDSTSKYSLLCTKLTKTSIYLMPLLYTPYVFESRTSMLWETNLINCYTGTREEGYMKHLYVVYRFSGDTRYTTFEGKLMKHACFNRKIDLDKYHVMYVFNIPQEQLYEYYCFITGKFSKFTEEYKQQVLKFSINPAVFPPSSIPNHPLYGVLYQTKVRKKFLENLVDAKIEDEAELDDLPYEHLETYNGDIEIPDLDQKSDEFN